MKNYFTSSNEKENVFTAIALMKNAGVNVDKLKKSGYSDVNGVSVYFKQEDLQEDKVIRVSAHSISNKIRMEDTICFSFDAKTLSGKVVSKQEKNKLFVDKFFTFLK